MGKIKTGTKFDVKYHIVEEKRRVSRIWFHDEKHPDKRSSEYQTPIPVSDHKKEYCIDQLVKIKDSISDILTPMKVTKITPLLTPFVYYHVYILLSPFSY